MSHSNAMEIYVASLCWAQCQVVHRYRESERKRDNERERRGDKFRICSGTHNLPSVGLRNNRFPFIYAKFSSDFCSLGFRIHLNSYNNAQCEANRALKYCIPCRYSNQLATPSTIPKKPHIQTDIPQNIISRQLKWMTKK